MKTALYISKDNYKNGYKVVNLTTERSLDIAENQFGNFLYKLLIYLKTRKQTYLTIFVFNLQKYYGILNIMQDKIIKRFVFKNTLYNIIFSDILYPDIKIIFKDCIHFLSNNKNKNDDYNKKYLIFYSNKLRELFKIDIYKFNILSITGVARILFRKISKSKKNLIKKLNEREDIFIRKAFYGGRTEIITPYSNEVCYFYDVNSLYPYIMKNYAMPIGIPKYWESIEKKDLENFYGIINVHVRSPKNMKLPILPIKSPKVHSMMGILYPTGDIKALYFSEELKFALKYGYEIVEIYDGYEFKKEIIFDDFVDTLYNLRKTEENKKLKKYYKLIMNSLYGRYGTIYEKPCYITNNVIHDAVKKKFENVAICVAITAYARIYMYNIIMEEKLDVLYWDTDGIIIRDPLPESYISAELGKFKLVAKIDKLLCLGTKFYMYQSEDKYKYVFRGFKKENYDLKGHDIYNYLIHKLFEVSEDPYQKLIQFDVGNINGEIESKQFIFHQKREYKYYPRGILTIPWHIAAV